MDYFFVFISKKHPKERMILMVNIIKQELPIEESLRKKIEQKCFKK
jgi:hypothetical protein